MVLNSATSLGGSLEGVGPENRDFFGPWNGTSEASAIWAQKSRDKSYEVHNMGLRYIKMIIPEPAETVAMSSWSQMVGGLNRAGSFGSWGGGLIAGIE